MGNNRWGGIWPKNRANRRRVISALIATPVALIAALVLAGSAGTSLVQHGPLMPGHQNLACIDCHLPARRSTRQQLQASVRYLVGLRDRPADLGNRAVTSADCLTCHERENERHPIYRFREPRFEKARAQIDATSCLTCHTEHTGHRVALDDITFCRACHEDLKLKQDPIDVPHTTLIAQKRWDSCLGCHDFHSNHPIRTPLTMACARDPAAIRHWLADGPDPYSTSKTFKAKTR